MTSSYPRAGRCMRHQSVVLLTYGRRVSVAWPLSGVQVVDLSSGLAGAYCAKLLADGGADVVKVEDADGDRLRRVVECGAPLARGDDGALFRFLCASSASVVADVAHAHALIAGADVVVWSAGSSVADDVTCPPGPPPDAHPGLAAPGM